MGALAIRPRFLGTNQTFELDALFDFARAAGGRVTWQWHHDGGVMVRYDDPVRGSGCGVGKDVEEAAHFIMQAVRSRLEKEREGLQG